MTTDRDGLGPSRRQLARRARRDDGDRSARLARALMTLSTSALVRLALDDQLRAVVDSARRITANVARRREERRLAGVLLSADFDDLEARLAKVTAGGDADRRPFHHAEVWRTRLLDDPAAAPAFVAAHPTIALPRLAGLIEAATRERATGRPPGAARALFRFVLDALSAPAVDPDDAPVEDADEDDADDQAEADEDADDESAAGEATADRADEEA